MDSTFEYTRVSQANDKDDTSTPLINDENDCTTKPPSLFNRVSLWTLFIHSVLFLISLVLVATTMTYKCQLTDEKCAAQVSAYSPLLPVVEYEDVRFQGSFRDKNQYKGQPSPQLDAAWDRITYVAQIKIEPEEMIPLRKPFSQVRVEESEGVGYAGGIEVFHQLHCLNIIRQFTYHDYYASLLHKPPAFTDTNDTLRLHIDHCIDILRQALMCNGDVGIITRSWMKNRDLGYPDFSVWHKCRRLDSILRYSYANEIDIEPVKPLNAVELSVPPCTNASLNEICP